jgi:uncharacterized protein (DUF2062 family)
MLFKRREKPTRWERVRLGLWPRVSWRRSTRYHMKRILRLSGRPSTVALGTAIGTFASFTPFLGFHILIALALAWPLRGNLAAAAIGTFVGNPVSYPFIWAGTYEVGHVILHGFGRAPPEQLGHTLAEMPLREIIPVIQPMAVGAVPLGLTAGLVVYAVVYQAVGAYRDERRKRFAARREPGCREAPP